MSYIPYKGICKDCGKEDLLFEGLCEDCMKFYMEGDDIPFEPEEV